MVGCKITIPASDETIAMEPGYWPTGITCRRWEEKQSPMTRMTERKLQNGAKTTTRAGGLRTNTAVHSAVYYNNALHYSDISSDTSSTSDTITEWPHDDAIDDVYAW